MLFTIFILTFITVTFSMIPWITHIQMVRDSGIDYGWANYKAFKREFAKYNWTHDGVYENSLFDYNNGCKLHASIFKFDYKGMIMYNPIEYLRSVLHIQKHFKSISSPKRKKVDWNRID
ncbi:hypothetical protein [Rossellomorea marisflavi]|uniref:hypothetical protein n=1 Tax=Rossellomorea marisflavi TaxID=189381 RepID=UPI003FA11CF1